MDGPEPIIQMSGSNADRFKLDDTLLRLGDEFNGDRDSLIKITVIYHDQKIPETGQVRAFGII